MPDSTPPEYITKTEAARLYRRSERSISRDITNAVKFRDQRLLSHVELRLEDGTRRAGTELTIEEIVELRDRGLNPTWMLETTWLRNAYGSRAEPLDENNTVSTFPSAEARTQQPLPEDLDQRVAVLTTQNEALRQNNADLRSQNVRLEKELDRRAEELREENELQRQNNVLIQQVYNLLSAIQGLPNILPAPSHTRTSNEPQLPVDAEPTIYQEGTGNGLVSAGRNKKIQKQSARKPPRPSAKRPPVRSETKSPQADSVLRRWFPPFLGSNRRQKN